MFVAWVLLYYTGLILGESSQILLEAKLLPQISHVHFIGRNAKSPLSLLISAQYSDAAVTRLPVLFY